MVWTDRGADGAALKVFLRITGYGLIVHATWSVGHAAGVESGRLGRLRPVSVLASELGARTVVVHPPFARGSASTPAVRDGLRRFADHCSSPGYLLRGGRP